MFHDINFIIFRRSELREEILRRKNNFSIYIYIKVQTFCSHVSPGLAGTAGALELWFYFICNTWLQPVSHQNVSPLHSWKIKKINLNLPPLLHSGFDQNERKSLHFWTIKLEAIIEENYGDMVSGKLQNWPFLFKALLLSHDIVNINALRGIPTWNLDYFIIFQISKIPYWTN